MPRISHFHGISIYMYYRDRAPPHFHAIAGGHEAEMDIDSADILKGSFPRPLLKLVTKWARAHRDELQTDWQRAQAGQPLQPIDPLS